MKNKQKDNSNSYLKIALGVAIAVILVGTAAFIVKPSSLQGATTLDPIDPGIKDLELSLDARMDILEDKVRDLEIQLDDHDYKLDFVLSALNRMDVDDFISRMEAVETKIDDLDYKMDYVLGQLK